MKDDRSVVGSGVPRNFLPRDFLSASRSRDSCRGNDHLRDPAESLSGGFGFDIEQVQRRTVFLGRTYRGKSLRLIRCRNGKTDKQLH